MKRDDFLFIRCSDNCAHQKEGLCALKNVYSSNITSNIEDIDKTGCIYYKEKTKKKPVSAYDNTLQFTNQTQSNTQMYFY